MRTQMLLKLHHRAQLILEMIEKADGRAKDAALWVSKTKSNKLSYSYATIKWYEKRLQANTEIKNRLMVYYSDVMVRIAKPIIEGRGNVKPIMSFKITEDHAVQLTGLS